MANPQDVVKWLRRLGRDAILVKHDVRPVPLEEARDVRFVNRHAVKQSLPVEGGQCVELEQNQTFRRRGRNIQFRETVGGPETLLHLGKEGIGRQQHIHPHAAKAAPDEISVLLLNGNFQGVASMKAAT